MKYLWVYLIAVNVITMILFGVDKWKAKHGRWRIPEATLIVFAVIGGSAGALLGMLVFHHKTRKRKFSVGIPVILILQIAAATAAVILL